MAKKKRPTIRIDASVLQVDGMVFSGGKWNAIACINTANGVIISVRLRRRQKSTIPLEAIEQYQPPGWIEPTKRGKVKGLLSKKDPDFFKKLGAMGGASTKAKHDADYYRKTAILSHQIRRERAAAVVEQAESSTPGRPDKPRSFSY